MIRINVPIDVNAVATSASAAFALATPLRVEDVIVAAIVEALGSRAPQDKRERSVLRTLERLDAGDIAVEIDGRLYESRHAVVVCAGIASLRFFARRAFTRAA
jgi:hypothetical protein